MAKVAPCINFAKQRSLATSNGFAQGDPFTGAPFSSYRAGNKDEVALFGEVSAVGYYKLRPNLTLQASWDMMFLVGMALAPEQLLWVRDPADGVNNNGYMYTQGISATLIWTR